MSYMTRVEGVPDRDDLNPGMAHIPGTGPIGKTCGDCKHRGYYREASRGKFNVKLQQVVFRRYKTNGCAMYLKLAMTHGEPVKKNYAACRYFEQKDDKKS